MAQDNPEENNSVATSTARPTTTTTVAPGNYPKDSNYKDYPTDTIAAVTIAVLAVVIILTLLLVFRALRKRQRARRGQQFGETHIPTLTTGVMGTGGSAYTNAANSVSVRGAVSWESINPSSHGQHR